MVCQQFNRRRVPRPIIDSPITANRVRRRSPARLFRMNVERTWFEIGVAGYSSASTTTASMAPNAQNTLCNSRVLAFKPFGSTV
jgi:hypothetical protein